MPSDISKDDIREALRSYHMAPTPPRALNVINYVSDLLDELDVKDERLKKLNELVDEIAEHRDSLEHELKVANSKIQDMQRGRMPEPDMAQDYQELLEAHRKAVSNQIADTHTNASVYACIMAIPPLLAENARLRQDSEILRKCTEAASAFAGLLAEYRR